MKFLSLLIAISAPCLIANAASIDRAAVEQTAPGEFKVSFAATPDSGDISIFASSRPDRIDSAKPLVEKASSPVVLKTPDDHRVYFHLKPAAGPTRVVATRDIPLEGSINFRDLGGYATADGRHVRWGMVFRSAKLDQLTAKDYDYISSLGLKLVCDFRMPGEIGVAVTHWQGASPPELWNDAIDTPAGPRNKPAPPPQTGAAPRGLAGTYRWMAIEGLPEFAALMRKIANGQTPTLFHCQEGRGRTGLFAAMLLRALGVPKETVMYDFMLTNDYLFTDAALTKMANAMGGGGSGPPRTIESMRNQLRISPDLLDASFAAIEEAYPNYDDFLLKGLKLTPAEIASLRTRLLEP